MDYDEHVAAVDGEIAGIVDAVALGPIDAMVPTCPGWMVADLVEHVGLFTGFWTHVLCEGTGRPKTPFPEMPEGGAIGDWYAQLGAHMVDELRASSADQPVWTWVPDRQNAAFAARRCANELAVHRFDVQSARGVQEPIDAALAEDGIEEILVMIEAFAADGGPAGRGRGETLFLQGTDRNVEWLLRLTPAGLEVEQGPAHGVLELRGAVSDLELVLYQRPAVGSVERVGDEAVLDAWYRAFHFE